MILAGDIGATKTNLAVYSSEAGPRAPLAEVTFPSGNYPSLDIMAGEFLAQVDLPVDQAAFGVAGPVVAGRATVTNLPWVMDEEQLRESLNLSSVRLLNDLHAIAHSVPILGGTDLHTLNEGEAEPGGAMAVVAPGTGLGEAYLTWDGSRYRAHPSEGGHASFAPDTPLQLDLLRFLLDRFQHVSCERVCSGKGLPNIYAFLKESGRGEEPDWLTEQLAEADDPTPVIVKAALDTSRRCDLCVAALSTFVSVLGSEAGNMALKVLATGGVYLGGGIPPRILSALDNGRFMAAFQNKGRLAELLGRIPVHVILNPRAALLGAACYGLDV